MANINLKIDHQILKKARNIARKKKISLDTIVDQKLNEFAPAHQKKRLPGQGWRRFFENVGPGLAG
jgi:hypothetical protein